LEEAKAAEVIRHGQRYRLVQVGAGPANGYAEDLHLQDRLPEFWSLSLSLLNWSGTKSLQARGRQ
jgi:hypothetical protein